MEMFVASFSAGSGGRQYRSWDSSGIQYGASVTLAGKTLLGPARVRHRLVTNTPTRPASLGSAAKIPLRLFFFFSPGEADAVQPPAKRRRCEEAGASGAPFPSCCRRQHVLFSLAALGWLPLLNSCCYYLVLLLS